MRLQIAMELAAQKEIDATRIQSAFRCRQARAARRQLERVRAERMAIRIQCAWRVSRTRASAS